MTKIKLTTKQQEYLDSLADGKVPPIYTYSEDLEWIPSESE